MKINTFRTQMQTIRNAKTLSELSDCISQKLQSGLALIPLLLFALTPLYQLIRDSISPPQGSHFLMDTPSFSYAYTMTTVFSLAAVFGLLSAFIQIGKIKRAGGRLSAALWRNKALVWFGLFLLWAVISTCINGFTHAAMLGDAYRNESLFVYMIYILGFFFCGMLLREDKHRRILLYSILGTSIVIALSAMVHTWLFALPAYRENVGLSAVFHQFNHYGYFLLISILLDSSLFALEKDKRLRLLCAVAFLLNNVVLILNDTFGCYLAAFIGLLFQNVFLLWRNRRVSWESLAMLGGFLLISLGMSVWYDTVFTNVFQFLQDIGDVAENPTDSESAGTGRWTLWTHTATYISEKPLFGFGVEGIHDRLDLETNGCNNRPHNEYLQYAAFFGIPAALFYLCGLGAVFVRAWRLRCGNNPYRTAALIAAFGYLVSAFFGNTMYYTAPYCFLLLGTAYATGSKNRSLS